MREECGGYEYFVPSRSFWSTVRLNGGCDSMASFNIVPDKALRNKPSFRVRRRFQTSDKSLAGQVQDKSPRKRRIFPKVIRVVTIVVKTTVSRAQHRAFAVQIVRKRRADDEPRMKSPFWDSRRDNPNHYAPPNILPESPRRSAFSHLFQQSPQSSGRRKIPKGREMATITPYL